MRRAAKRDLSEKLIVDVLRKCGWSVLQISVPDGPDLFAARAGHSVAIEVKTGKQKLRPGQERFKSAWQGEYVVLRNVDEALAFNRGETLKIS